VAWTYDTFDPDDRMADKDEEGMEGDLRGGWDGSESSGYEEKDGEEDGREAGVSRAGGPRVMEGYDYLYGVNVVLAALRSGRREVEELYIQEGMTLKDKKDKAAVQRILTWEGGEEGGVKKTVTDKHHLNMLADNRPVRKGGREEGREGGDVDLASCFW